MEGVEFWTKGNKVSHLFFFEQKTAYDVRISDWSSDVCSSDLRMMSETSAIRPKILVVDDTPANLVAMRRLLARMDCEVVEVGDGNAALSACLDHEFALILLDVQMPEMDGFEVATQIGRAHV